MSSAPSTQPADITYCSQCGRPYRTTDLVRSGQSLVCAECKSVAIPRAVVYGGFWRRFAAVLLDGIILGAIGAAINGILALIMPIDPSGPRQELLSRAMALGGIGIVINLGLSMCYEVYFLTRSGATPGKMALGLKVITAKGGPISPGLAFGRYFAKILSSLVLMIGYIIAAFDSEKRALHDHICNTRVIRVA